MSERIDIVDVLLDSTEPKIDANSDYPLLDGSKKYTVQLTELRTPITLDAVPEKAIQNNQSVAHLLPWLEVRRKNTGIAPNHADTTLHSQAFFEEEEAHFLKNANRPISSAGDFIYYLQRYFDDIKLKYIENGNIPGLGHGDGADYVLDPDELFVQVGLLPSGQIRFLFSNVFTERFYITVNKYAQKLIGIQQDYIAFRVLGGVVLEHTAALLGAGGIIIAGEAGKTVELRGIYPIDRFMEHRIRIEVESQMPIPPSIVWSHNNRQQLNTVISTFPIEQVSWIKVKLNNVGIALSDFTYRNRLLTGDITFRSAQNNVQEKYLIQNPKFFHNIRLELFIVRKEWDQGTNKFVLKRRKMEFTEGQSFTAKLRFQTV